MKSQVQQLKIAGVISLLSLICMCAFSQTGNNVILNTLMVNSYAGNINKIIAGAGLEYLSGSDDNTPSTQSHSFSTLYATNHTFYGYMDHFINIPADTKQRGLIDPYVRLGIQNKKVTTTYVYHFHTAHFKQEIKKIIT